MANIFSLYGNIFIDNEKANKSIDETTEKGKKSSTSFTKILGNVMKAGAKMATAVVGSTTAVVTGLTAMASKTASTADTFDKASLRTGLQVEELQRLNYAAGQSGVEMSTLEKSAKKLNDRLSEVAEGNKTTSSMFKKLGVTVKDSNGNMKSSTDVYNEVLTKLADMGDTVEATAIGTDLFGKAFTDMKPLLAAGSSGIEELKNRADDLGIVMSQDAVSAGVKFGDTIADIKQSLSGSFNSIMSSLIPVLQTVADLILDNMPTIQGLIGQLAPVLTQMLSSILPPFMKLAQSLLPIIINLINKLLPPITKIIEAILPVIIQLIEMLLPPIVQIIDMILPVLISLIEPLMPLLQPIFDLLQPLIDLLMMLLQPLIELLNMILPPLISLFSNIIQVILPGLKVALSFVANVLGGAFKNAFENIKLIVDNVKNVFQNIIDFVKNVFTGNWKGAWENVKNIFSNIASGLGNIFKTPINFIIDLINGFIGGLNKIKIPDWVPGVGGMGFNIGLIPKLRVGMDYVPYDEYPALLHKGEAVLTKQENAEYRQSMLQQNSEIQENSKLTHYIEKIFEMLLTYFPQFAKNMDKDFVFEDGTIAARLTPLVDRNLSNEDIKRKRGN